MRVCTMWFALIALVVFALAWAQTTGPPSNGPHTPGYVLVVQDNSIGTGIADMIGAEMPATIPRQYAAEQLFYANQRATAAALYPQPYIQETKNGRVILLEIRSGPEVAFTSFPRDWIFKSLNQPVQSFYLIASGQIRPSPAFEPEGIDVGDSLRG